MARSALIVVAFALFACDTGTTTPPDFGDAYAVPADGAVSLADGQLSISVEYAGGCEAHTFRLGTRAGDREVWAIHDAHGDTCEALVRDLATFDTNLGDGPVTVLTPDGRRIHVGG